MAGTGAADTWSADTGAAACRQCDARGAAAQCSIMSMRSRQQPREPALPRGPPARRLLPTSARAPARPLQHPRPLLRWAESHRARARRQRQTVRQWAGRGAACVHGIICPRAGPIMAISTATNS
jgi:hypothetical protein